jgi:hypothetical protein
MNELQTALEQLDTDNINNLIMSSETDITAALEQLDTEDIENNDDIYEAFNKSLSFYDSKIKITDYNRHESIFNRMQSMVDKPLNEVFDKIFENNNIIIDSNVTEQLEMDIGIPLENLEMYITNYKRSLQTYFNNIIINERDIIDSVIRKRKLLNWMKQIKHINLSDNDNDNDNLNQMTYHTNKYISTLLDNNDLDNTKKEYNLNKKCFAKLMSISREINNIYETSKCMICLTRNVDTFMNPCGHTGCSECIKRHLYDHHNTAYSRQKRNCFICKTNVVSINKIYYS